MSSSDDSWDNSADSNSEWDLTSDDSNSSDVADGEEAEFNDIDGLLPEGGEVGTYVELDGAESDHDRNFYGDHSDSDTSPDRHHIRYENRIMAHEDFTDANQDDSHLFLSSVDEISGDQLQPGRRGFNNADYETRNRLPASSELDVMRQIRALEHRIQRDVSPGIQPISTESDDEDWFYNCIHAVLPAGLSSTPKYTPLPTVSSIRVISLHAGRQDDVLSATLDVLDLDNPNIEYEAISYRWGPPALSKQPIFLSGRFLHINNELKEILIRLRRRNCARVVWADALCINQADMLERRQQVSKMQRIYSQASRVIIYLQGDNLHTNLCFKAVKDLTSAWITFHQTRDAQHSLDRILNEVVGHSEMSRIAQIFENCYWTRLWVVQEIVSSRLAIVHWNGEVISWTLVGLATTLIRNNKRLWNMFTSIKRSGSARAGLMNAYLMYRLPSARFRSSSMSFLDLIRLTRRFNVTEPLDRIYAILGLPSQQTGPERHFITPDYRLLRQGLYTRVFHWVVTTHETPLEILSAVRHTTLLFPDFPTWIPEWHIDPIRSIGASHRKGMKFDASAGWPSKPLLHVSWRLDQRSLTLEGFVLGTITSSQQIFSEVLSMNKRKRARQRNHFKQEVAT
ncbi:HET domain-containing protein [Fusarium keratoplasticum]|uniref:HET domain-containing protein n=1 Tax=Fusarium keratoplasticum TaxID=1328300 RepID=A0ACC0QT18_9HYPO|nr:HET domain-containing protein [Fusarium keratoplasticum]KAI8665787.1 HET domain-containing protein [Fusarium keratoplasticum]